MVGSNHLTFSFATMNREIMIAAQKIKTSSSLGLYWHHRFDQNDNQIDLLYLHVNDHYEFILLSSIFSTGKLWPYALDLLHFALFHHVTFNNFWPFVIQDIDLLQRHHGIDQIDMMIYLLLLIEDINHRGYNLPLICFDLQSARDSYQNYTTPAVRDFLERAQFLTVPYVD